jgi:signal transduction histidine kinase
MRRLIGLLRAEPVGIESATPSLRRVDDLAAEMRDAGLSIAVEVDGDIRRLPPGVDLAAYRIVQEALTNVLKHAPSAHVHVAVHARDDAVELEVLDDGVGAIAASNGHVGHGLLGMRERAAIYGGTITLGPQPGAGFRVHARIPLEAA